MADSSDPQVPDREPREGNDRTIALRGLEIRTASGVLVITSRTTNASFHGSDAVAVGSSSSMSMVTGQSAAHLEGVLGDVTLSATGTVGNVVLPPLSIGAVLVTGERVNDGVLVESVASGWEELFRRFSADPTEMYRVNPRILEEIVAGALKADGEFDDVILTPRSGDGGRDVIAIKGGRFPVKLIGQVKRYGPEEVVTAEQVSAFLNLRAVDHRLTNALFTTTGSFAPRLRQDPRVAPFLPTDERGNNVGSLTLIEGPNEMLEWFEKVAGPRDPRSVNREN